MTDFSTQRVEPLSRDRSDQRSRLLERIPASRLGQDLRRDGEAAFEALLGKTFAMDAAHPADGWGFALRKSARRQTSRASIDGMIAASAAAGAAWGRASADERVGALVEIISRLNKQSF